LTDRRIIWTIQTKREHSGEGEGSFSLPVSNISKEEPYDPETPKIPAREPEEKK
jgi:hypothetical protein